MRKKIVFLVVLVAMIFIPGISVNAENLLESADDIVKSVENNEWVEENGNTYYYRNGEKVKGFQEIEGKTYFFSEVNYALKAGLQKQNNDISKMFYLNEDGTVYHGWKEIEGNTYYFGDNHYAVKGFQEIEGHTYFFSEINYALKTGLQKQNNDISKMFYLNDDGTVYHGWKEMVGNTYYFGDNHYAVKGFQEIEGKTYFFSEVNYALKTGLQKQNNNISKMFYLNDDGTVYHGWKEIDGNTCYFGDNHYAVNGMQIINSKTYYFDNYKLTTGLMNVNGNLIYANENGEIQYGWKTVNKNTYYFGSDGYALSGFQEIEGKTYFFSKINYALKSGWQTLDNLTFYLNEDGTLFTNSGWQTIDNKQYYFENNYVIKGTKEIDGNVYYFDTTTGEFRTGLHKINGNDYYYDSYGKLVKIQYYPVYYSQRDDRWSNTYYGTGNMKNSGCAPTALAMAFSGILETTILPIDVAYYLYWYTSEFNKPILGASGLAVQLASSYFNVPSRGLSSLAQVEEALSNGKIVFANVGPGKFTSPGLTHAIILYKNEDNNTYAYDPYNSNNNGKISISTVWNQKSTNSYDLRGGYAFYALG